MRIAGSWTIARPFGVPIRIHWSVPVCAVLAGRLRIAPGAWLAFVLLILIHEIGHLLVVRRVGARARALDVLGFGGLCWWDGAVTPLQRACIAWGGIWAQMFVLLVTGLAVLALGKPSHAFAADMVDVALVGNLWLMGVNLLPIPPLDGSEAWSLFPLLRRRLAARRAARRLPIRIDVWSPSARSSAAPPTSSVPAALPSTKLPAGPAADDVDEGDYTPEVLEVLERTRAIARDAARDPTQVGRVPPRDEPGSKP